MGERKVLNKYYPPDFDPAKLPRGQRGNKDAQMKVRMMLAMSVRCSTCGNYMYKGTKFNMRMEDVVGEDYLGIKIFRFYFHCKNCGAEITMKTDPQNSDYAMEQGATRNYEPWREKEKTVAEAVAAREEEERGNAMKALENRTLDSKNEMDIMDALEELQAVRGLHNKVSLEDAIAAIRQKAEQNDEASLQAQDEELIRQMYSQRATQVRRLDESAATAALLDGDGGSGKAASLATVNEHWDGGAGAAAAAEAAAQKQAKPPPEKKPPIAPRLAVRPKFAVKPKAAAPAGAVSGAAAPAAAPLGQNEASAAPDGAGTSAANGAAVADGGRDGSAGGNGAPVWPGKRPAGEGDAGAHAAEPAAKRSAPAAGGSSSPAPSGDGGGIGLPGLLGDYGSDDSNS